MDEKRTIVTETWEVLAARIGAEHADVIAALVQAELANETAWLQFEETRLKIEHEQARWEREDKKNAVQE